MKIVLSPIAKFAILLRKDPKNGGNWLRQMCLRVLELVIDFTTAG